MSARSGPRAALLAGVLAVLCVACGDARGVRTYEPGVYKGADDPLLELQGNTEHQQKLRERFTKSQGR